MHTSTAASHNITAGREFSIMRGSSLVAVEGTIKIGDRVSINVNVLIDASDGGEIEIGDDVLIGPNVVIRASDHEFERMDLAINQQGHRPACIVIERDTWIAANVVIVGGVRIGEHSVVAAGAVVTRDVEPASVVAGVPARLIRRRVAAVHQGAG